MGSNDKETLIWWVDPESKESNPQTGMPLVYRWQGPPGSPSAAHRPRRNCQRVTTTTASISQIYGDDVVVTDPMAGCLSSYRSF